MGRISKAQVRKLGALAVAAALIFTQHGCVTSGATADTTRELLALNQSYDEALVASEQQIESFASGAIDLLEGKGAEVTIRQYGETVVLTGRFKGKVRAEGREYSFPERYSTVWVQDRGDWKMVLEHGTVIPDP